MGRPLLQRLLLPFGRIHENEAASALLMFFYSFLAMTAYNIIQPIQRSLFIEKLGSTRIPYVQLAAGILIGIIMTGYSWLMSRLPRRWALPAAQGGIAALLVAFWFLFQTESRWVSAGFYIFGLILGILLISQFWTLANVIYDARQAKRLFGFIGGGSSLGGMLGASITWLLGRVGTVNLLLVSAGFMLACLVVVMFITRRESAREEGRPSTSDKEGGVGLRRAVELLVQSRHLRIIALVISFGAIGAAITDQQLNMATEAFRGKAGRDAMTAFLGQVRVWISAIGFVIQVALTSRIHRYLGVGFALLLLPIGLGATGTIILLNAVLWAPALARILDQSLRYTVDKTTREILYMPLPSEIKYEAKPFVDVTLDRFAKGMTAVILLIMISPWGLRLGWQQLSYLSVGITAVWIFVAVQARRGYQTAFRQSMESRVIEPAEVRVAVADLSTIEALIQELASPDERRVLYAIDMLESLDKRSLITPLLLYHESAPVRVRALGLLGEAAPGDLQRWLPAIQRMMADESPEVRAAAVGALANLQDQQVTGLVRPYLQDGNPRIRMTAAMVLSGSSNEEDVAAAERVLRDLLSDTGGAAAPVRREFPIALRHVATPRFRRLLIPLLHDTNPEVAEEAMRTVRRLGTADFIFVPTLISLLRNRRMKSNARETLVASGERVLNILEHFLRDPDEDIWVRRSIPDTVARIPCGQAMNILAGALDEPDGLLRFKILSAMEKLHRGHPAIAIGRERIEALALEEAARCSGYLRCRRVVFERQGGPRDSLLERALAEKQRRSNDRIFRCLGLIFPWRDIAAARGSVERGSSRSRPAALEYLDNLLSGVLRKKLMPVLEESVTGMGLQAPSKAGGEQGERMESCVARMIDDPDPVLAACAVLFAGEAELPGLRSDLEKALAGGSGRLAAEAAAWVLARDHAGPSQRGTWWTTMLPIAVTAERLRRMPHFASMSVDGLFRIAFSGNQVRHEPRRAIYQEGVSPENLSILLAGRVSCRSSVLPPREIGAPAALAMQEMLGERPMDVTVRTMEEAVCLVIGREEFRTLMADDTELIQGMFSMASGGGPVGIPQWVAKGTGGATAAHPDLTPVEKVFLISGNPFFGGVGGEEVQSLGSIAAVVRLEAGTVLSEEPDPPSVYVVAAGGITLDTLPDEPASEAGPTDAAGIRHTLTGSPPGRRVSVLSEGLALRIDRDDLFELLAQRPDLLRQVLGAASRSWAAKQAAPA